ncbi:MAG: DUF2130 domain-containing protein [Pseudomonadota bacterium]|nr:DUF2130 domain-containing protein [Pseudomonadota bacterium]
MTEPTIACPTCGSEIRLTESLAAPLVAATRRQFEQQLAEKDANIAARERSVRQKEGEVLEAQRAMDHRIAEQVAARVKLERARVADEEATKAKLANAAEMEGKVRELRELHEVLKVRNEKLASAQLAEAALIKKQRELDDAKRELELTVEKRIQSGLEEVRLKALHEAEDGLQQKVLEKEQIIASMQRTIEELKQKAHRGSQQLQGEVQELQLESLLLAKFPFDSIQPVPKGEFGGDVVQAVRNSSGQAGGTILWEVKRTRNWSDAWLAKLREDQRAAKAEICILVSNVLPADVATFDMIEGVWVVHPRCVIPVATVLRDSLLQVHMARQASAGQQSKTDMVYRYLTGPRFRQRVEAIVEAFTSMQEDLDKERKVIMKQWAKRDEQIERVMAGTIGMYGDLQGIAGKSLQEIEGLELRTLELDLDPKL